MRHVTLVTLFCVGLAASSAQGEVRISDSEDEGLPAFKIETPAATYYLQKASGAFSSIIDRDGRDWVGFHSDPEAGFPAGAASQFRGLPNLVYQGPDNGVGHPGFEKCASTLVEENSIRTVSASGEWRWTWTFADSHADLHVEKIDPERPYWFLYEGPIAGAFAPSRQYWGSSQTGPIKSFDDYFETGGRVGQHRWAYFGDEDVERVFYVQQLTPDRLPDLMGCLGDTPQGLESGEGMVVFGFGREVDAKPLLQTPNRFRVGFVEKAIRSPEDHHALAAELDAAEMKPGPLEFSMRRVTSGLKNFWAHMPADVTGDGVADWFYHTDNAYGGGVAFFQGQVTSGDWRRVEVAESGAGGEELATGDMELADMDGDGDIDPVVLAHTGEWEEASAPSKIYWYENPSWTPHEIGDAPAFVKDVSLSDLNGDARTDVATLTFEQETLSVFRQDADGGFTRVVNLVAPGLHEGMDAGDLDGDGDSDIATCGYVFFNPGGDLSGEWRRVNLDPKWNSQTGDWSRNATKVVVKDLDGDGANDVVMSHSERDGFPVSWYTRDAETGEWREQVILENLPAAHTLEVEDMDLDGDLDVVTGVNWGRAIGLEIDRGDVLVLLNDGDAKSWTPMKLSDGGIYNGRVIDYDGDGDYDLFRLPHHGAEEGYLFENLLNHTAPSE